MDLSVIAVAGAGQEPCQLVATDGRYGAWVPATGGVEVVDLQELQASPLSLQPDSCLTAITIGSACMGSSDPQQGRQRQDHLLVTANSQAVVVWRLGQVFSAVATDHPIPPPLQALSGQGAVDALVISTPTNRLAVCAGRVIHIIDLPNLNHAYRLEGHAGSVLAAAFCDPHQPDWLLTTGEDRTFRLWDLGQGCLLYQSSVLGASPLVCVAIDPSYPRCVLGAADGTLRFFDLAACPACRCMQVLDLSKQLQRAASAAAGAVSAAQARAALPAGPRVVGGRASESERAAAQGPVLVGEPSQPALMCTDTILGLAFSQLRSSAPQGESGLLGESPKLMVGTMRALVIIDTHAFQVVQIAWLSGSGVRVTRDVSAVEGTDMLNLTDVELSGAYAFACAAHEQYMVCCTASSMTSDVHVMSAVPTPNRGAHVLSEAVHIQRYSAGMADGATSPSPAGPDAATTQPGTPLLSVFMTKPLPPDSPLNGCGVVDSKGRISPHSGSRPSSGTASSTASGNNRSPGAQFRRASDGNVVKDNVRSGPGKQPGGLARSNSTCSRTVKPLADKPVTFHRQIKSSGYGYVQPAVKLGRPPPSPVKVTTRPTPVNHVAKQLLAARQYPCDGLPPGRLLPGEALPDTGRVHQAAVLGLKYSGDGSRLLTCSADKTARIMKLPLSKYQGEGTDLMGHNGAVTRADWSQTSTMVLTASTDRTAALWMVGCAQPLLRFTHMRHQQRQGSTAATTTTTSKLNPVFTHEVQAALFFYLDRFVMLATGSKLCLYSYGLNDADARDDVARLKAHNTYSLTASYTTSSHLINTCAAVNIFQSPVALLATSSRSVEVLDCTSMQQVACVKDAHTRPVHTIVQSAGASIFTSHAREAQEMFATCAADSQLKLWDIRTCRCVRTFTGHKNTQISVGAAFSPCLRFIACGSEDQAVHMFDLRQGVLLQRLREGNEEAVSQVAFHPLNPQLAAGSLAGPQGLPTLLDTLTGPLSTLGQASNAHSVCVVVDNLSPLLLHQQAPQTALHQAARCPGRQELEQLCSYVLQHWQDVKPAIQRNAANAQSASLDPGRDLLQALLDQPNSRGQSSLHVAVEAGNVEACKYLLSMNANPWVQDRMGKRTALHVACMQQGQPELVHLLARDDSPWAVQPTQPSLRFIEAQTVSGFTALHFAMGHADNLRALLQHNPKITVSSAFTSYEFGMNYPAGTTPLHVAATTGNLKTACILMCHYALNIHGNGRNGASIPDPRLLANSDGLTPWRIAKDLHFTKLAQVLHPSYPLRMFVQDSPSCPSLQALAAAALKQHLLSNIQATAAPLSPTSSCSSLHERDTSCSSASTTTSTTTAPSQEADNQEDEEQACCNICFDAIPTLQMTGCRHRMCAGCAQQLCTAITTEPSRCPFCRSAIPGFAAAQHS